MYTKQLDNYYKVNVNNAGVSHLEVKLLEPVPTCVS